MVDVIYIHGLSRSGSTLLQSLMSRIKYSVGLGELARVIRNHSSKPQEDPIEIARKNIGESPKFQDCICGSRPDQCVFWSGILPDMTNATEKEAHDIVLNHCANSSNINLIVDASKTTEDCLKFYGNKNPLIGNVKVLHIIRDFRGWVCSVEKYAHLMRAAGCNSWLNSSYVARCYSWYYSNRKGLKRLQRAGLQPLIISYERLVKDTQQELDRIREYLHFNDDWLQPSTKEMNLHELYGNAGFRQSDKKDRIQYDMAWCEDMRSLHYGPLLLPVYRFNKRYVYNE